MKKEAVRLVSMVAGGWLARGLATEAVASSSGMGTAAGMCESFTRAITPAVAADVRRRGYAVVDGVFGEAAAWTVREELLALRSSQLMQANATHLFREGQTKKLYKQGIWEAEAHTLNDDGQAKAANLVALSKDRTLLTMLNIMLATSPTDALRSQTLKMQVNDGRGACFPLHFDADLSLDGRRVTALYYANPNWDSSHGGELVLYPSLDHPRVMISPLHDRLVLFSAPAMLHRVRPHTGPEPRCCFTIWLFARDVPIIQKQTSPPKSRSATLEALMRPEYRKHLFKAVLCDEWAESIAESHPETSERAAAIATFWEEVALITRVLNKELPGARDLIDTLKRDRQLAEAIKIGL